MATRYTDRTLRSNGQWIKITRDSKARTFTFARGHAGVTEAHDVSTLSFVFIPTWAAAMDRAQTLTTYY